MNKIRISRLQVATMFMNLVFGKAIGFTSEILARLVSRDAWISMLFAFVFGAVMMAVSTGVAVRFRSEPPERYIPRLMGRPLGYLALLLLAGWLAMAFATSAVTIHLHMVDYMLPETPIIVFVIIYTLICIYGAFVGIEVIGRLSVLGLFLTVVLDVLLVMGSIRYFQVKRLLPVFEAGPLSIAAAGIPAGVDIAMATACALVLLPRLGKPSHWYRLSLWAIVGGCAITIVWPILEIGLMGPHMTSQFLIACMQLARSAQLSIYLPRYEMVMVVLFAYSVFSQSMVCLYATCELLGGLPWLKKVRWSYLVTAVGLISMPLQYLLAIDHQRYNQFLSTVWPLSLLVVWGLPLIMLVVTWFRPNLRPAGEAASTGESC